MSEISLREYLADLDRLLNQHAADDVILHSRHILQYYPKIVDAYRYLGRALILNGRWDEAEAALRRVIAVVPDDYYAHTGLSEIYDRNRRGDEAIWHLERALEQNPNQRELIDSLRSLYKRYRNIDQAKVPMTAGGVARQAMANQSYEQAIETLRSALVRHKDRVDLRLLLAESLWAGSDPVEAAESAMDVLEVLPDCLSANAIMTRLWLHEGRSSDAQRYLNRVEAVAPYLAVEIATNQTVDDNAFRIEKLDVKRSAQAELSLNRPDWLQDISPEAAAAQATADEWSSWSAGESGLLAAAGIAAKPENTPSTDWSSDAQTLEQPIPSLFDLDENTDSLVANATDSEMPEWMNAPTMQVPLSAVQAAQDAQEDDALAWLQSNDSPSLADDEMPPDELLFGLHEDTASSAPIEEEALDWLKGFDEDGDTGATPTAEIPDWMMDDPLPARNIPEPDFATSSPVEPAQNFDWAANDQFLDEALGIESLAGNESAPIAEPTIEDLDWLAGAAAFEQASEQAADDTLIEAGLTGIPDEPDSYDPFAAAASAAPKASEEMIAEDDAWLDQVSNEPAGVPGPKRGLTAMLKDANFDWMNEETSTELPSAIDQTMDDWTRQFDPAPAQTSNDNPDWLQAIESGDDTAVMRVPSAAAPAEDAPSVQEDAPTEVLDAAALTAAEAAQAGDDFDWANVEAASEDQAADSNAYPALDMLLGVSEATGAADAAVEAFDNNAASAEAEPISESDLDWLGEVGVTVEKPANEAISASEDDLAALFGAEAETQPEIEADMELDWLHEVDSEMADQLAAEPAADREDDLEALFAVGETELADELAAQTEAATAEENTPETAAEGELDWLHEVDSEMADQLAAEPAADREDDLEALFAVSETELADELAAQTEAITAEEGALETAAEGELDWLNEIDSEMADQLAAEPATDREDDLEALFAVSETELADELAAQTEAVTAEGDALETAAEGELDWLHEVGSEMADQLAAEPAADREDDLEALFAVGETELADATAWETPSESAVAEPEMEWLSEADAMPDAASESDLEWLTEAGVTVEDQPPVEAIAASPEDLAALFGADEDETTDQHDAPEGSAFDAAITTAAVAGLGAVAIGATGADEAESEPMPETEVAEVELDWLSSDGEAAELTEAEVIEAEPNAAARGLTPEFEHPVDEQDDSAGEDAQPESASESEDAVNWWETPESEEAPASEVEETATEFTEAEQQVAEVSIVADEGDEFVDWFVDAELDEEALNSAPEIEVDPADWYADAVQDEQFSETAEEAVYSAEETRHGIETVHFATGENAGEFPDWLNAAEETSEQIESPEADVIDESVGVIDFIEVTSVVSEIGDSEEEAAAIPNADENVFADEVIPVEEITADSALGAETSDDDIFDENIFAAETTTDFDSLPAAETLAADSFIEDDGGDEALLNDEPDELSLLAGAAALGAAGLAAAANAENDDQAQADAEIPEATEDMIEEESLAETTGEPVAEVEAEEEAINAPDWLNAMVPGLDVDYEAEEDQPIETEYLEPAPESVLAPDEIDASEANWLEDLIAQEERESLAAVEAAAGSEPRFKFSRGPIWFKHNDNDDDITPDAAENADSDLPEWLR